MDLQAIEARRELWELTLWSDAVSDAHQGWFLALPVPHGLSTHGRFDWRIRVTMMAAREGEEPAMQLVSAVVTRRLQ